MALQGNHQILTIPDLFGLAQLHRMTGILAIACASRSRAFFIQHGEVVYAVMNDPGQLLGQVLVRELGIDARTIEGVMSDPEATGFLGAELVKRDIIEQEALDALAVRQIRRAIFEVLRWPEWAFHFHRVPPADNLPALRINTQALVFDLAREMDEWDSVENLFPDLELVPERDPAAVAADLPTIPGDEMPPPEELLVLVDGERTLRAILDEAPYPVLALGQTFAALIDSGHVRFRSSTEVSEEDAFASRLAELPVIHYMPAKILSLINSEEPQSEDLEQLLLCDPVLAARILRVGILNGHWHGEHPFEMRNLLDAFGHASLLCILLAEVVRGLFLTGRSHSRDAVSEQALKSSVAAQCIAELSGYPDPGLARTGGLVQDVGRLILASQHGDRYRKVEELVLRSRKNILEAEQSVFGTDHCKVGLQLAKAWDFPISLQEVIGGHHSEELPPSSRLLLIIRLANAITVPPGFGGRDADSPARRKRMLGLLGLGSDALEEVERRVSDPELHYQADVVSA